MIDKIIGTHPLEPGLWQLTSQNERYRVSACGSILIDLEPGDVLIIQDPEGGQCAEVTPFNEKGKGDPGLLGISHGSSAIHLQEIISSRGNGSEKLKVGLERRVLDWTDAKSVHLFSTESGPGEEETFEITQKTSCVIVAYGKTMTVEGNSFPPTDLRVFVERSTPY